MKSFLLLICFLVLTMTSYSQQYHYSKHLTSEDYLRKSKTQKTVGRCLLVGGVIMLIVGVRMAYEDGLWGAEPNETDYILPLVGAGSIISSIPIFIISSDNKRKAASIHFEPRALSFSRQNPINIIMQPSFTIKIGL